VVDELQEIPRGIHPALLSKRWAATGAARSGRRATIPIELDVRIDDRLPEPVEVGAYYVVSEMLTNAAKHSSASVVEVNAETSDGTLRVSVRDDGIGGADPKRGFRAGRAEGPHQSARRHIRHTQPTRRWNHRDVRASGNDRWTSGCGH
jgi:signal transduction histidine kinase